MQHLTCREGSRHHNTPINADNLTISRCRYRSGRHGKCDVPSACHVTGNPERFRFIWNGTGPAKPYPSRLRYPHFAPMPVQSAHIPAISPLANNPEPLISASFPPRRPTTSAVEEGLQCPVMVAQCLLLHYLAPLTQPRIIRTRRRELPTLLNVPGRRPTTGMPPGFLLDRQIPHKSGVRTVSHQRASLFGTYVDTITRHENTVANHIRDRASPRAPA